MKKTLAILALALFLTGVGAPAIASVNQVDIVLNDEDPKKKKAEKKKATKAKDAKCDDAKKSECCDKQTKKDCNK